MLVSEALLIKRSQNFAAGAPKQKPRCVQICETALYVVLINSLNHDIFGAKDSEKLFASLLFS
jgi:hypothetical protein